MTERSCGSKMEGPRPDKFQFDEEVLCMKKRISMILGLIMLIIAIAFIVFALNHCGSEIGNAAKYNRQLAAQKQLRNPDRGKKGTDAVDSAQPEVVERTRIDLLEKDILPSSGGQKRTFRRL